MSLPRRAGWFRRWRFGRRVQPRLDAVVAREPGFLPRPAASAPEPTSARSDAPPAAGVADGLALAGDTDPLVPPARASTTRYPVCACGVPLPLHREHEPCRDFERVAGGRQPASSAPGDALGVLTVRSDQ